MNPSLQSLGTLASGFGCQLESQDGRFVLLSKTVAIPKASPPYWEDPLVGLRHLAESDVSFAVLNLKIFPMNFFPFCNAPQILGIGADM
jgi:hypothetical protein